MLDLRVCHADVSFPCPPIFDHGIYWRPLRTPPLVSEQLPDVGGVDNVDMGDTGQGFLEDGAKVTESVHGGFVQFV